MTIVASFIVGAASPAIAVEVPELLPPTIVSVDRGDETLTVTLQRPDWNGDDRIVGYTVTATPSSESAPTGICTLPLSDETDDTVTCAEFSPRLTNGVAYTVTATAIYRPAGTEADVESPASPASAAVIPAGLPGVPSIASVTSRVAVIDVCLNQPEGNGAAVEYVYIRYRPIGVAEWGATARLRVGSARPCARITLQNLARTGTVYEFSARSENSVGRGDWSVPTENDRGMFLGVPSVPVAVTGTGGDGEVTFRWDEPSNSGDGTTPTYEYALSYDGETWNDPQGTSASSVRLELENGTTVHFKVRAVNGVGPGDYSPPATATARLPLAPSAPSGLEATPGDGTVELHWEQPDDGGSPILGYDVQWSLGAATFTDTTTGTSYTAGSLTNGTAYRFRVRAVNAIGVGEWSEYAPATPVGLPSAPRNVTVTAAPNRVHVEWDAPLSDGGRPIVSYGVRFRQVGNEWSGYVANAPSTTDLSFDIAVGNGREYEVQVHARVLDANGERIEGPWSESAFGTPRSVPDAPAAPTATGGDGSVHLEWEAPNFNGGADIDGYWVRYQTVSDAEDDWTTLPEMVSGTSITVDDLDNGTVYRFAVAAHNQIGTGGWSTTAEAKPRTTPAAPTDLDAKPGVGLVDLSWVAPTNTGGDPLTGFEVTWTAADDETVTGTIQTSDTEIRIPDLTGWTAYAFEVRAINDAGPGAWSEPATVTPFDVPTAPTGLTATHGDGVVDLVWDELELPEGAPAIIRYELQYATSDDTDWDAAPISELEGSSTTVDGLTNGTSYAFRVRAVSSVGDGAWSGPVSETPSRKPDAPTITSLVVGDGAITVTWEFGEDGGDPIHDAQVSVEAPDRTGMSRVIYPGSESFEARTYHFTGLRNGVTYRVWVDSANRNGFTVSDSQFAVPATVPDAPTDLVAEPGNALTQLRWTAPGNGGHPITGYIVRHLSVADAEAGSDAWVEVTLEEPVTERLVSGLDNGVPTRFQVAAINDRGTGPWSVPVDAAPQDVPGTPSHLEATPQDGAFDLSWDAPADPNPDAPVTGYEVQWRETDQTNWTDAPATSAAQTTATIDGLRNGTPYEARVRAVNFAGPGPWATTTATPRTVPGEASWVSSTPGNGKVDLVWSPPRDDGGDEVTGYEVQWQEAGAEDWSNPIPVHGTRTTIEALTNGTAYEFQVRALNAAGPGRWGPVAAETPRTTPGLPADVALTPGDGLIAVRWTPPSDDGGAEITGYQAQARPDGGDWSEVVDAEDSSLQLDGLDNGIRYDVRVRAVNPAGAGEWSTPAQGTPRTVPDTPHMRSAVPADAAVKLRWDAPVFDGGNPVAGYAVRWKADGDSGWSERDGILDLSVEVDELRNGAQYTFQVRAENGAGDSEWSESVTATPRTVPGEAMWVSTTPDDKKVTLNWAAPADDGGARITGYEVHWRAVGSDDWSAPISVDGLRTTVEGLTNGAAYEFQVRPVNVAGEGPWSAIATGTPRTTPSAPQDLQLAPGDATIHATWTAAADDGGADITGYEVQTRPQGGDWSDLIATEATSLDLDGLDNGTRHDVRVRAVNAAGGGEWSAPAQATPRTTPDAPKIGSAAPADTAVLLNWDAPVFDGGAPVTGYTIRWQTETDESWSTRDGLQERSTTIDDLENGVEYTFQVQAHNVAGDSDWSDPLSATPRTIAGEASWTSTTPGDGKVDLAWTVPTDDGGARITGYEVQWRAADAKDWSEPVPVNGLSTTIDGLSNGTTYEFQVRAVNAAGGGLWGPTTTTTPRTVPKAPENVTATPGDTVIDLVWDPPADNGGASVSGYEVQTRLAGGDWSKPTIVDEGSFELDDLDNGTAYEARVRAVNVAGEGEWAETLASTPFRFEPRLTDADGESLAAATLYPGDRVLITDTALPAGAKLTLELHSSPAVLGTAEVGTDGKVQLEAVIPTGAEPGAHTLVATLTGTGAGPAVASVAIRVEKLSVPDAGDLASTGASIGAPLAAAPLLLMAGLLAVLAGRRRIRASD